VKYVTLDFTRPILPQLLAELYARRIQSVLVEGGTTLIQGFIDAQAWDEAHVEIAPIVLGDGVQAPRLPMHLNKEVGYIRGNRKEIYRR
jgi:diaminohydroxyphosphoribosylaminopyrimidine deaminase/5-amino-6-(5-phosphoribosylamino)uracil reductase